MATRSGVIPNNPQAIQQPSYRISRRIESFVFHGISEHRQFLQAGTCLCGNGIRPVIGSDERSRVCDDETDWEEE